MATRCFKCKVEFEENESFFECDACRRPIHSNSACSELCHSELKCMQLKRRSLQFLCEDCTSGLHQVPALIKAISDLRSGVEAMRIARPPSRPQSSVGEMDKEDMICEMLDRQNRASNLIILNINESQLKTQAERISQDTEAVKKALENFYVNKTNLKMFRLGKKYPCRYNLDKFLHQFQFI
ncbi:hypothetical protein JTB14_011590 [Gonioctena quinquepunctata]|nr:hypothetical protein JTB14_011590 [Gonioctena quinquepunctata]